MPLAGAALVVAGAPRLVLGVLFLSAAAVAARRPADRDEFRRAVARLGEVMGATHDRSALVKVTVEAAMAVSGARAGRLWRSGRGGVHPVVASGDEAVAVDVERIAAVLELGEPARWHDGSEAVLAVPIRASGGVYGVLTLHRASPFGATDEGDVVGLARQVGTAIEATYLHEEARRLSLTDGLTGLWNRRQFELRAAQERERALRFDERFAVVLVDLDDFKAVNDTHGHLVGDAVLVETANRLVSYTREVDTVARFGGEEFVLLLPQTDSAGALRVAEKVRAELAAKPVETDAGPLPVTLSAGVASHPADGESLDELLAAADEALYAAKAAGKNRVHHATSPEPGATPS